MTALEEFLHQGMLPFVGRDAELDRLIGFWRATPYAQMLRASLVQAEAGIGKSRLLDELIRRVAAEEGMVVHVKFYPESAISLGPLLASALWNSALGRELLRAEPEGTLPSVIGALRRLCRLRPTLIVLEDTHLLSPESTPELASLMNALSDETVSVLCVCRPSEWKGRSVMEGFLVERIEMEGLDEAGIGAMWEGLFGAPCDAVVAGLLHRATLGNALALRSVLRSGIDSRVIARAGDGWSIADPGGSFARLMKRNVELLSAAMVAHLEDDEMRLTERLACLGEIFSREAAGALIGEDNPLLERLLAKGVLSTTSMLPSPLGGLPPMPGVTPGPAFPSSAHPLLVFTHTLLHKHLAERAAVDAEALIGVIAGNHPIYSLLPFSLAQRHVASLHPSVQGLRIAAERALYVAWLLDQSLDQHSGMKAWETASAMFDVMRGADPDEDERWGLRLMQIRVSLLRFGSPEVREECARKFYEATSWEDRPALIPFRLTALGFYTGTHRDISPGIHVRAWEELERIIETAPAFRLHRSYIKCLGAVAQTAALQMDHSLMASIRIRVEGLLGELPVEERKLFEWMIYPFYLLAFDTPEELEDRREMYRRIEGNGPGNRSNDGRVLGFYKVKFLAHTGEMDAAQAAASDASRWFREQGIWNNSMQCAMDGLSAQSVLGRDLPAIEAEMRTFLQDIPYRDDSVMDDVASEVAAIGLLRGDPAWGWRLCRELGAGRAGTLPMGALVALALGDLPLADECLRHPWSPQFLVDRPGYDLLGAMLRLLLHADGDPGDIAPRVAGLLGRPVLRLHDTLVIGAVITILRAMRGSPACAPIHDALRDAIAASLDARLTWFADRQLAPPISTLLDLFGEYLEPTARKRWGEREVGIRDARSGDGESQGSVTVSMLGTIQVGAKHGKLAPLRGVRIRTLLGLMVADQMIGASLTPQEFILLAGEDDDPELARKKRNMGVVRLREIMGADAILTDGRTPRLNLALVEVDLLRADELVKRSLAAAREGAWVRAQPLLLEALQMTRGEVPFPTLYEGFFEAAREDFDFRLRSAVLDIARGLLREGDTGGAEEILRRAFDAMPDDQEIAELLRDALVSRGNRVEAERIRLRAKEAAA
ncbi:MAG: hypothetical protein JWQ98_3309 [Chlorobi bacterium]|nr:hypothetical protein [Chlorobiota bacterium]